MYLLARYQAHFLIKICPKYLGRLVHTTLATGMTLGELLALEWYDVDLMGRRIEISATNAWNNRERYVPMNGDLDAILDDICDRQSLVGHLGTIFHHPGLTRLRADFREACEQIRGLADLRWADLRHTCASWMAEAGGDAHAIAQILGYQDLRSVERYFDLDDGDAREPMMWDTIKHAELDRYDDLEKPPGYEIAPKPRLSDRCTLSPGEVIELTGDEDDEAG